MLRALNPLSTLAMCLIWLAASIAVADAAFQAAVILLVAFVLIGVNGTRPLLLALLMVPFVLFGFGFVVTDVLFRQGGGVIDSVSSSQVIFSSGSLSAGIVLGLRAVACGMISAFFALTTDPGGFVRALVKWCRLPPALAYSAFSAMQMVPAMAADLQEIRMARAMQTGRRLRRFPAPTEIVELVVPLLAFAIRRASRTAIAMEARGFGAGRPRSMINVPSFSARDAVFVPCGLCVLVLCLALSIRF